AGRPVRHLRAVRQRARRLAQRGSCRAPAAGTAAPVSGAADARQDPTVGASHVPPDVRPRRATALDAPPPALLRWTEGLAMHAVDTTSLRRLEHFLVRALLGLVIVMVAVIGAAALLVLAQSGWPPLARFDRGIAVALNPARAGRA